MLKTTAEVKTYFDNLDLGTIYNVIFDKEKNKNGKHSLFLSFKGKNEDVAIFEGTSTDLKELEAHFRMVAESHGAEVADDFQNQIIRMGAEIAAEEMGYGKDMAGFMTAYNTMPVEERVKMMMPIFQKLLQHHSGLSEDEIWNKIGIDPKEFGL